MNVTKHAIKRYIERILNIKGQQEQNYKAVQNENEIKNSLENLLIESKFIYQGQVSQNKISMNFYLCPDNETVIVTDTEDTTIITIYKINFAFPTALCKTVITELVAAIKELNVQIGEENLQLAAAREEKNKQIEVAKAQIAALEERFAAVKKEINLLEQQREQLSYKKQILIKERQVYVEQLLANTDLKADIAERSK